MGVIKGKETINSYIKKYIAEQGISVRLGFKIESSFKFSEVNEFVWNILAFLKGVREYPSIITLIEQRVERSGVKNEYTINLVSVVNKEREEEVKEEVYKFMNAYKGLNIELKIENNEKSVKEMIRKLKKGGINTQVIGIINSKVKEYEVIKGMIKGKGIIIRINE